MLLVGLIGCDKESSTAKRVTADELDAVVPKFSTTNPTTTGVVAQLNGPYADVSLSLDKYVAAGVPAIDKPWGIAEYQAASNGILKLGSKWEALPRFESERSGALFNRMVSAENLKFLSDTAITPEKKMQLATDLMTHSVALLQNYLANRSLYNREVVESLGLVIRLNMVKLQAMQAYVGSLDKTDPKYQKLADELHVLREGLSEFVRIALNPVEDWRTNPTSCRIRMCDILMDILPEMLMAASPEIQGEATEQVAMLAARETELRVKTAITKLKNQLAKIPKRKYTPKTTQPTTKFSFN